MKSALAVGDETRPRLEDNVLFYKKLTAVVMLLAMGCSGERTTAPEADEESNGPGGIVAGALQVSVRESTLGLKNQTEFKVGYVVVEKHMAIIAMMAPCVPGQCSELVQGAERVIAFRDIAGYTPASTEAMVYWWKWVPGPSGLEAVGFTGTSVKLK